MWFAFGSRAGRTHQCCISQCRENIPVLHFLSAGRTQQCCISPVQGRTQQCCISPMQQPAETSPHWHHSAAEDGPANYPSTEGKHKPPPRNSVSPAHSPIAGFVISPSRGRRGFSSIPKKPAEGKEHLVIRQEGIKCMRGYAEVQRQDVTAKRIISSSPISYISLPNVRHSQKEAPCNSSFAVQRKLFH